MLFLLLFTFQLHILRFLNITIFPISFTDHWEFETQSDCSVSPSLSSHFKLMLWESRSPYDGLEVPSALPSTAITPPLSPFLHLLPSQAWGMPVSSCLRALTLALFSVWNVWAPGESASSLLSRLEQGGHPRPAWIKLLFIHSVPRHFLLIFLSALTPSPLCVINYLFILPIICLSTNI